MTVTWSSVAQAPEREISDPAAAASELFERHRRRVLAFCRSRTRNATDAEDATQTTFMYALTGLQRGVVPQIELAWLLRIAENVCHSMRRRAHRRYEREELPADLLGDVSRDPAVVADRTATIADALETLPESQRRAIILREWRGLSYEDIAVELDTSHAAVETLLFRARRTLAKNVASIGTVVLHLPQLSRLGRWLLGSGAGKATAVTAATITLGAGLPSDVPADRGDVPPPPPVQAPARSEGSAPTVPTPPAISRADRGRPVTQASAPPEGVQPVVAVEAGARPAETAPAEAGSDAPVAVEPAAVAPPSETPQSPLDVVPRAVPPKIVVDVPAVKPPATPVLGELPVQVPEPLAPVVESLLPGGLPEPVAPVVESLLPNGLPEVVPPELEVEIPEPTSLVPKLPVGDLPLVGPPLP